VEHELRTATRIANNFDFAPANIANARSERFRNGFFAGQPGCQPVRLIFAVGAFFFCKKPVEKSFAKTDDAIFYTLDFNQINTTTQHIPSIAKSTPTLAALPSRWPLLPNAA
jgi:hypothetical protein